MPIKTRIDRNGLKQILNDQGFELKPMATTIGVYPFQQYTQTVGNAFTASVPGFYFVSGSTQCTGTIPTAASLPGAMYQFTLTNSQPMRLTCSLRAGGAPANFAHNDAGALVTASFGASAPSARDDGLGLIQSGSVCIQSNGILWVTVTASGTLTFAPAGAPGL